MSMTRSKLREKNFRLMVLSIRAEPSQPPPRRFLQCNHLDCSDGEVGTDRVEREPREVNHRRFGFKVFVPLQLRVHLVVRKRVPKRASRQLVADQHVGNDDASVPDRAVQPRGLHRIIHRGCHRCQLLPDSPAAAQRGPPAPRSPPTRHLVCWPPFQHPRPVRGSGNKRTCRADAFRTTVWCWSSYHDPPPAQNPRPSPPGRLPERKVNTTTFSCAHQRTSRPFPSDPQGIQGRFLNLCLPVPERRSTRCSHDGLPRLTPAATRDCCMFHDTILWG